MNRVAFFPHSLKQLRLFFVSAGLLALASCEKPENNIGLELQPGEDILGYFTSDTTSVQSSTVREDSLRTDELTSVMLGNYDDPVFGRTMCSVFTQLKLSSVNADFPSAFQIDSVVLSMVYSGTHYGRLTPQAFQVYEMTGPMHIDSTYYTNSWFAIDESTDLVKDGEAVHSIRPESFVIVDGDSLQPQLRIPLDHSFGTKILTADPSVLTDNDAFLEYFKGIYVRSISRDGALFNLDLVDSDSKVTIFYRDQDGDEEDTLAFALNINSDCARFTRFDHDYSGTVLSQVGTVAVDGSSESFVQAGGGVKTHIEFPNLTDYAGFGNITINKAELIIPVSTADAGKYTPQQLLFLLYKDEDGENQLLPDQNTNAHSIGGTYNENDGEYRFNITRYIQRVINGELPATGIYVVSNSAGVSGNRVILHGPSHSEEAGQNMRLLLTFSE